MNIPASPEEITEDAVRHVKSIYKDLIKQFVPDINFKPQESTVSVFMAGSPGAGKTEFSTNLIEAVSVSGKFTGVVRIDPDDFRMLMPGYNGSNSSLFNKACSLAVTKLHDYVLEKGLNFIMDGTFSDYKQAKNNVERSLKRGRRVIVFYLYLDPIMAWDFTLAREKIEGRNIPKEVFIEKFFAAREVVNKVKDEFQNKIELHAYKRDIANKLYNPYLYIDNVDKVIPSSYTPKELEKLLKLT